MEALSIISSMGTLLVAIAGICIAITQIRAAARDAHDARAAEMAWQVYEAYVDSTIQTARGVAELISRKEPVPASAAEYGNHYAQRDMKDRKKEDHIDKQMRRLLRFYNQIGILMDKSLIDDDLVFALIGPGLRSGWPAVKIAVEWYQDYHAGSSGIEKAESRKIYIHIPILYERYVEWEARQG